MVSGSATISVGWPPSPRYLGRRRPARGWVGCENKRGVKPRGGAVARRESSLLRTGVDGRSSGAKGSSDCLLYGRPSDRTDWGLVGRQRASRLALSRGRHLAARRSGTPHQDRVGGAGLRERPRHLP